MKKLLSVLLVFTVLLSVGALTVAADDATASVTVTIAAKGDLTVAAAAVTVADSDGDGVLTVSDALYAAHEAYYEGGAAAGYNAYLHAGYGLSLGMLWGDNSGNFGYTLNNATCRSLADAVQTGDTLAAYIYADTTYYADMYTYFDNAAVAVKAGEAFTLALLGNGYDAAWNPVTVPVAGATVTVNGEKTAFVTDADGKVTVTLDTVGDVVISAVSDAAVLVPPVCKASVTAAETVTTAAPAADSTDSPTTGDNTASLVMLCVLVLSGVTVLSALKARV